MIVWKLRSDKSIFHGPISGFALNESFIHSISKFKPMINVLINSKLLFDMIRNIVEGKWIHFEVRKCFICIENFLSKRNWNRNRNRNVAQIGHYAKLYWCCDNLPLSRRNWSSSSWFRWQPFSLPKRRYTLINVCCQSWSFARFSSVFKLWWIEQKKWFMRRRSTWREILLEQDYKERDLEIEIHDEPSNDHRTRTIVRVKTANRSKRRNTNFRK